MHNHSYRIPWLLGLMSLFVLNTNGQAQVPAPASPEGVEVLAKGPVHEAFAATAETPKGGSPIVKKAPPEPIEELPPDQKPEGDQVQWLPGYWSWDEDRSDFIWISGFWRVPPPGRVWVASSWREAPGGFQWVNGFWQETQTQVEKSNIEYLPPPPAPVEIQPSVPAPSEEHIYVPGSWVYRNHYVWRPGFWVAHRPGWIWIPATYRWTPAGYIFIDGYWDYPLEQRGMLFAPIAFTSPVYARPRYYYQPTFAISVNGLYTSMFVRRGYSSYYFGDYYGATYVSGGYNPWCGGYRGGSGFAISIGFGRGPVYDPMWDYYRVSYRNNPTWNSNINLTYAGRYNGTIARPPVTLVQQTTVINNITNNNTTVNNTTINNNRQNLTMVTSIKDASTSQKIALKPVTPAEQVKEQQFSKDVRNVGTQRRQMETQIAEKGGIPTKTTDKPHTVTVNVPQTVVARAQVTEAKKASMPEPAPKLAQSPPVVTKPVTPVTPTTPNTTPVKPVTPVPNPKVDPKPGTPVPTTPKMDPVKPVTPVPTPKVDPKPGTPVPSPKVDPVKPVTPVPTPKVDPKPMTPVTPVPTPKVDPKPVTPSVPPVTTPPAPKPPTPPVVNPPKPVAPATPPMVQPRPATPPVNVQPAPRPVAPAPRAEPKGEPKGSPKGEEKPSKP